ncbi:MAG: nodulation protein NfeD [Bryobacteraceae bacterium]
MSTFPRGVVFAALFSASLIAQSRPKVMTVTVDRIIAPVTAGILDQALDKANNEHADLVLIRLNTPGGLLDASRSIVARMVASNVPIAVWVGPSGARAASAGFFLLEAADIAAMAPGTNTGAASPVLLGQEMDQTMRHKVENDTTAWLRSVVNRRGRNAALAEATVLKAQAFTETEALKEHLIEIVARDEADLLRQLDGRQITRFDGATATLHTANAQVIAFEPGIRERVLWAISDPNIAFLLLILGALGLYVEFTHPGLVAPGVAGGILLVLGLFALSVLPIRWLGVALLLLSVVLFVLEALYTSHGVLGVGGAISLVMGAVLLIDGPPEMRIQLVTALAVALPFSLITVFLASLAVRAHRRKVLTGDSGMIGEIGKAWTALGPSGKVFVHGEYWDADSDTVVPLGSQVRVVAVEGLRLRVQPLT